LFALFCAAVGMVAYLVVPAITQKIRHDGALAPDALKAV
jgi:hypothetical protein